MSSRETTSPSLVPRHWNTAKGERDGGKKWVPWTQEGSELRLETHRERIQVCSKNKKIRGGRPLKWRETARK